MHVRIVRHADLTGKEIAEIGELFDSEYLTDYGPWNPDGPYGYSSADVHTLVFDDSLLLAHVGFQRRSVVVGGSAITIAGTGGVLVRKQFRVAGLGRRAMRHAHQEMSRDADVDFGYLGCREEVVPFYESAGWHRIRAVERHVSRLDQQTILVSNDTPILICAAAKDIAEWPSGDIDLRGTPW